MSCYKTHIRYHYSVAATTVIMVPLIGRTNCGAETLQIKNILCCDITTPNKIVCVQVHAVLTTQSQLWGSRRLSTQWRCSTTTHSLGTGTATASALEIRSSKYSRLNKLERQEEQALHDRKRVNMHIQLKSGQSIMTVFVCT